MQQEQLDYLDSRDNKVACAVCAASIDDAASQRHTVMCSHSGCNAAYHSRCLAQRFLAEEAPADGSINTPILPTLGTCTSCGKALQWLDLIKGTQYRELLRTKGAKGVEEELERQVLDEFADLEHDGSATDSAASTDTAASGQSDSDDLAPAVDESAVPSFPKRPRGRPRKQAATVAALQSTQISSEVVVLSD